MPSSGPNLTVVLVTMLNGLAMVGAVFAPLLAADAVSLPQLVHVSAAEATDLETHHGNAPTTELPAVQHVAIPSSTWRSTRIQYVDMPDVTQKPHHGRGTAQLHQIRIDDGTDLRSDLLLLATAQRRVTLDW